MDKKIKHRKLYKIIHEKSGENFNTVKHILDIYHEELKNLILSDNTVSIHKFGTFKPKHTKKAIRYSTLLGKNVIVQPSRTLTFTPSKSIKVFENE